MSRKVEKVQKGGGSAPKIKKSTIQNVDFLIRVTLEQQVNLGYQDELN